MKPRHLLVLLSLLSIQFFPAWKAAAQELEVRGRVVDFDGSPVAKATVQLVPLVGEYAAGLDSLAGRHATAAKVETITNSRGTYLLKAPEAGMWWVRVEAKGSLVMGRRLMPLLTDVEVPPAQLVPAQFTQVVIYGARGKALPGALVSATNDQRRRPDDWFLQRFYGLTDEEGKVRVPRPLKSQLTVFVHHQDYLEGVLKDASSAASLTLEQGKLQPILVQDHQGKALPEVLVRVGEGRFAIGKTNQEGRIAVLAREDKDQGLRLLAPDRRNWSGGLRANPGESPKEDVLKLEALTVLEGRVLEASRRDPVPGALIWLGYQADTVVRSDSRGDFRISSAATGTPWLQAAAAGYFSASARIEDASDKAPTLLLEPSLAVMGRVVDEEGEPVAQVAVRATAIPERATSRAIWQSGGKVTSEEDGTFRLRRMLPKASYQLEFTRQGYARTQQALVVPKVGEPFELEVVMTSGRMAFGQVVNAEEQPLEGAEIILYRQEAGQVPWMMAQMASRHGVSTDGRATSGKNGRFEVADLGPGRYRLEVERSGFASTAVPGVEIPEASPPEGFDLGTLVLIPGVDLKGQVVDEQGKALAGAEIYVQSRDGAMNFFSRRRSRGEPSAVADPAGRFVVPDHRTGEVLDLTAVHPGYVRANLSGVEVPTEDVVVLTLQKASSLAGRVVTEDGEGVSGVMVSAVVEQLGGMWNGQESQSARTQGDGAFSIGELPAGTARLFAQHNKHGQGELTGIEVVEGKSVEALVMTLRLGATLRGVVLGPEGQPVPNVGVREAQRDQLGNRHRDTDITDGDGQFRLSGLQPGKRTIEAWHKQFRATSKTLEVQPGENFLELHLGSGQRVLGQVVGADGRVLPAATVTLNGQQGHYARHEVRTDHEGRFEHVNVADGTYKLKASHPDHASGQLAESVVVAGALVEGLVLRLEEGAVITGQVLGLNFDELGQAQIYASSDLGMKPGEVDFEARYRVPGAAPGAWTVVVQAPGDRQALGHTTVEVGDREVELDLEIKEGYTLSGRVLHGEQPLGGARLNLSGVDVGAYGSSRSDYRGGYRIPGLEAGRYRLQVVGSRSGLSHREEIEITGDQVYNIVLEGGRVTGRVLEASGGTPLAGVRLSVEPLKNEEGFVSWSQERTQSNSQGFFDLGELSSTRWLVKAQKEGYSQASAEVEVIRGSDPPPVELTLSVTEGLWLTARTPDAPSPSRRRINLVLLDGQGRAVATTSSQMDHEGLVHFASAPAGSWRLLVASDGLATVRLPVKVPEDHPEVHLTPGGSLEIEIPDLSTQPATAHVELRGADGERYIASNGNQVLSRFPLRQDKAFLSNLPPGPWFVQVTAEDGRSWSGVGTAVAGEKVGLRLE